MPGINLYGDGGEPYADTIWNPAWLAREGLDPAPHTDRIRALTGIG
jgi:hypothetical protein